MKITLENGESIEISKESYEALAKHAKKELPKTWDELGRIEGFYVNDMSTIIKFGECSANCNNQNLCKTEPQAIAIRAMCQLTQLLAAYNDGWEPDWTDCNEHKYVICFWNNVIDTRFTYYSNKFLAFKTAELRDQFLTNFHDLIEQAKPLL